MKFLLLFFLFLHLHEPYSSFSLTPDGLSLLALKSAVDNASAFSDWNENDTNPCHWSGVSCMNFTGFSDPRVVGIAISEKNLRGYIPSELGTLVFLRRLNLHDNRFYGSIPDQLFNATALHSLFLYGNNLSGPLPPSICRLPRLQNVDLSRNYLSGNIPIDLGNCEQMQRLILAENRFSGDVTTGIWSRLANLVQLDLSSNSFNGSIPADLGELKSLSGTLNLSFNHFSGDIPKSLGNLPVTVSFDLRNNNLSGEIPQTGTFTNQGPTAFLDNPSLCGFPLQKPCQTPRQSPPEGQSPASGSQNNSRKIFKPELIIVISAADAAGVAFVGLLIVYIYWKKKDYKSCSCTKQVKLGGRRSIKIFSCSCMSGFPRNTDSDVESEKGGSAGEGDLVAIDKGFTFELDELLRASAYVLGKSGVGIVYKVVLGNGIPVAVRRLGEGGEQKYKEFAAEIQVIGKVKHPNIVRLRAYYWAPDEKLLISDFISNGSLAFALRGRAGQPSANLSWSTRLKIAKGIARGLAYLHESSPKKLVHGDIKPSNILMDAEFQPYVSDFGLNRLISIIGNEPSSASSSGGFLGGALPYIKAVAPERANSYRAPEGRFPGSRPTQKWDVYSFGVVLLELLTGKCQELSASSPTTSTSTSTEVADLVRWVKKGFDEEKPLSEIVDPMLLGEVHAKKEVLAMFHIALSCTDGDPEVRPRMKTVSENLERIGT